MPYKDPQKQKQAQRNAYLKKMGLGPEFIFDLPANRAAERLKTLEPEISAKYSADHSALSLGREYGISKNTVLKIAAKNGVPLRGKEAAGLLCRKIDTTLTPEEQADTRPIAQQVAEKLGYGTSKGLSHDREFRTACVRELRRRKYEKYRDLDRERKKFLNRIPAWQSRAAIVALLDMAHDLGLEVDHINPLKGKEICGLNVMGNLQLLAREKNQSKQNKFKRGPDHLIGHPSIHVPRGPHEGPSGGPPASMNA